MSICGNPTFIADVCIVDFWLKAVGLPRSYLDYCNCAVLSPRVVGDRIDRFATRARRCRGGVVHAVCVQFGVYVQRHGKGNVFSC